MMKSICLLLTLSASVSAFTPIASTNVKQTTTALNAFARGYVGNEGPEPMPPIFVTGSKDFDPLGFCEVRLDFSV
jgi:hypothetical protein